ncbi:MAG: hypothetical protein HFH83_06685 [Lachnospiraceae bacterium]|nr:hypothetical protein [Lachnospiraceae bacterium]
MSRSADRAGRIFYRNGCQLRLMRKAWRSLCKRLGRAVINTLVCRSAAMMRLFSGGENRNPVQGLKSFAPVLFLYGEIEY